MVAILWIHRVHYHSIEPSDTHSLLASLVEVYLPSNLFSNLQPSNARTTPRNATPRHTTPHYAIPYAALRHPAPLHPIPLHPASSHPTPPHPNLPHRIPLQAGFEPSITLELLAELLMSSNGEMELRAMNPLLADSEAYDLLQQASAVLLMVNREAHASRALALGRRLADHLRSDGDDAHSSEARVLADQLAALLSTKRAHIQPIEADAAAAATYDPRLLVFEFSTGFVLRAQQV